MVHCLYKLLASKGGDLASSSATATATASSSSSSSILQLLDRFLSHVRSTRLEMKQIFTSTGGVCPFRVAGVVCASKL